MEHTHKENREMKRERGMVLKGRERGGTGKIEMTPRNKKRDENLTVGNTQTESTDRLKRGKGVVRW